MRSLLAESSNPSTRQIIPIPALGILGNDDRAHPISDLRDGVVRSPVAIRQIESMGRDVAKLREADGPIPGKLGVHQEIHAAGSGSTRLIRLSRAA
jgi:hypothetical protein